MTPLIVLLCLAVGAVLATALVHLLRTRRDRTPKELRGDWWPRFEADFRAYAQRWAGRSRQAGPDPS